MLKDQLEQLAKENAFEYDIRWWNNQKVEYAKDRIGGNIVAFYKGRSLFNGVVALWGRDKRSAVLFYATPHDVADEKRYGWIPPVFRVEVQQGSCFRVPKNPKAASLVEEPAEAELPAGGRVIRFDDLVMRGRPVGEPVRFVDDQPQPQVVNVMHVEPNMAPMPVDEDALIQELVEEELADANRW